MRLEKRAAIGFLAGIMSCLLLVMAGLAAWQFGRNGLHQSARPFDTNPDQQAKTEPVNVLVLGVDERENVTGRSDTMFVLRVSNGQAQMLSIPRDTLVTIPGHGEGKANAAYAYGGLELAKQVVSNLLDIPITYYVKLNLSGFREMVDLMGGVTFNVPKAMQYFDPTQDLYIDLKPGPQVLDGAKAEQFVRFRHDETGDDVSRIGRQQEFLKAAATQALIPSKLPKLPGLIATARSFVQTDVPLTSQLALAFDLYNAQQHGAFAQRTVPGYGDYVQGISFFVVDQKALTELLLGWSAPANPS